MNYLEELFLLQDEKYKDFMAKLTPNLPGEAFIGVRTPALKKLAKEMKKSGEESAILEQLPHRYFEENQLHAFLISLEKDFDRALRLTEEFLPYIDNWATCDQLSPKVFQKHLPEVRQAAYGWMTSSHPYTIRFGIEIFMRYFLDDAFAPEYPEAISKIRSEEYYVNMMIAWYFATALAKQYTEVLPILEERKLDPWVHNKTIQKAVESYRVTKEHKEYLKTLKWKS
ncbi:MAG: DNA alkylation repair protein [Lachnospiraceae bacterium]|nr:DNA alkylation repair protein [Lachnospiraceae bacterium]